VYTNNHRTLLHLSSKKRHTSTKLDWSTDVCSSDLEDLVEADPEGRDRGALPLARLERGDVLLPPVARVLELVQLAIVARPDGVRSEERRVGNEGGWCVSADASWEMIVVVTLTALTY